MKEICGMQDITIDEVGNLSKSLKDSVDGYVTECNANMSYCILKDENGGINFDFSYLKKISDLARQNNKRLRIDSAVCFGDMIPQNLKGMTRDELSLAIGKYFHDLTDSKIGAGDFIEKIDVLNAVLDRGENEKFWIDVFGKDYDIEVLKIARDNIQNKNIKLCANEFFLTKDEEKRKDFVDRIRKIKEYEDRENIKLLDEIGVQDKFRVEVGEQEIISSLEEIYNVSCIECGKDMSITELSVAIGKSTIEDLHKAKEDGTIIAYKELLEQKINGIHRSVIDFANTHDRVNSIEARCSDKFDMNSRESGFNIPSSPFDFDCSMEFKDGTLISEFEKKLQANVYTEDERIKNYKEKEKNREHIVEEKSHENPRDVSSDVVR